MTDRIAKFMDKLTPKQYSQVAQAVQKIKDNNTSGLDTKPLRGQKEWFRCRIGKIRIVFVKTSAGKNIIYAVDFRGQVYKKI
jgi:mRNA-degrading endonuclease RelE of RelBE toxin-antitoxin system